ncbi:SDR family NAD(P)-dependent oxidoreductase [Streptomyces sp. M10(2022)]
MREAGHGKIVHIGSRSGFEGEPGVSVYSSSKFAVAGISEALSVELAPFGIQSMVVEPGVFRTDFLDGSSLSTAAHRIPAYDGTPAHDTLDWIDQANHTQLGDPVKGRTDLRSDLSGQAAHPSGARPRRHRAPAGQDRPAPGRSHRLAGEVRRHRPRRRRLTRPPELRQGERQGGCPSGVPALPCPALPSSVR